MSLDLAKTWATHQLTNPVAQDDAQRLFERVAAQKAPATLIVSPELMASKKGCLLRWMGRELVQLELTGKQQLKLGLAPGLMRLNLGFPSSLLEAPAVAQVTVSDVRVDDGDCYDGRQPLTGACVYR